MSTHSRSVARKCWSLSMSLTADYKVLEEQRDFDRAELATLWPPASIPMLRDGDRIIGETSIIIEYVAGEQSFPRLRLGCGTACATSTSQTPFKRSS
jgi:glutathione S-transferase